MKFGRLEVFGVIERAEGKAATEPSTRKVNQQAVDVVYRLPGEALYVAGRYNRVKGQFSALAAEIEGNRYQVGGGWFITLGLLLKAEYVNQTFKGYPTTNIRNGGKFNGMMFEGVVAF